MSSDRYHDNYNAFERFVDHLSRQQPEAVEPKPPKIIPGKDYPLVVQSSTPFEDYFEEHGAAFYERQYQKSEQELHKLETMLHTTLASLQDPELLKAIQKLERDIATELRKQKEASEPEVEAEKKVEEATEEQPSTEQEDPILTAERERVRALIHADPQVPAKDRQRVEDEHMETYSDLLEKKRRTEREVARDALNSKKASTSVKTLARWIANRCHPDKTKDKFLQEMFLNSKELRNAGDLDGLKAVKEVVMQYILSGDRSLYVKNLRAKQKALKEHLAQLRRRLNQIKNSQEMHLVRLAKKDEAHAKAIMQQAMRGKLDELTIKYNLLTGKAFTARYISNGWSTFTSTTSNGSGWY